MRTKKQKLPKTTDFFKPEEIGNHVGTDITGKLVIVLPGSFKPEFRTRKNLVWRANGGFGCLPHTNGRAVMATCFADGENSRLDRGQIAGLFIGDESTI